MMDRVNVWKSYSKENLEELDRINTLYKACLDEGKTERECVKVTVRMAEERGYKNLRDITKEGQPLEA